MIFLPPLQMTENEAFLQSYVWRENGVLFDFTGWTGTWEIKRNGNVILTGTVTLDAFGSISISATVNQVKLLLPNIERRGFTLLGTVWNATLTNGSRTLKFSAAVQLVHNKTAPLSTTAPNWAM